MPSPNRLSLGLHFRHRYLALYLKTKVILSGLLLVWVKYRLRSIRGRPRSSMFLILVCNMTYCRPKVSHLYGIPLWGHAAVSG